jgi:ABC-type proline/glycine betaine transport system ATPase subunit
LRDAPILILDEPTASLDVEAEVEVTRALDQLVVGRTVLVISHRLSTLGNVDEIIVLKEGRIAEQGTFEELKGAGGIFSRFLAEQNRYNLERENAVSLLRPAAMRTSERPVSQDDVEATIVRRNAVSTTQAARIQVELDGKIIGEYDLDPRKPVVSIGRMEMNDVVIPSRSISRMHARIRRNGQRWLVEDTESLNGLIYLGDRIDQMSLSNGDRILLAPKVAFQYIANESRTLDEARCKKGTL